MAVAHQIHDNKPVFFALTNISFFSSSYSHQTFRDKTFSEGTNFSVPPTPGIPIKTTLDNPSTVQYAGLIHQLVMKARSTVRDIDPQNDLTFLRVRSKKNEVMIAPGRQLLGRGGAHRVR